MQKVQQRFIERGKNQFVQSAFFYRAVADKLCTRIGGLNPLPTKVLELGARDNYLQSQLQRLNPNIDCQSLPLPFSLEAMAALQTNQFDLIIANLSISALQSWQDIVLRVRLLLKSNGVFFFSMLGPDSLYELKQAFSHDKVNHVAQFEDMHNLGDACLQLGFENPVLEAELMTVRYKKLANLFQDIKNVGWQYSGEDRRAGLTPKSVWQQMQSSYAKDNQTQRYHVSIELILGHAWAAPSFLNQASPPNQEVLVPITEIKKNTESSE